MPNTVSNEVVICAHCRHEMPLTQYHLDTKNQAVKKFYGKIDIQYGSGTHSQPKIQVARRNWYVEDLKELDLEIPFDVLIPVPLHKKKFREPVISGYDFWKSFG